jgi:hypothetical protein
METNTINLSVKDYNEMRDFNSAFKAGNSVLFYWDWCKMKSTICTKDETVKELAEINIKLKDEIDSLLNPKEEKSIEEIKKLTWWQFRKWKNNNN